jgi:Pyruvate/2-oxoacid:ferredoxin oxidoreductase gamma subunit
MRNLGGAVGLAGIYTFLNDRTDLHIRAAARELHLRASPPPSRRSPT